MIVQVTQTRTGLEIPLGRVRPRRGEVLLPNDLIVTDRPEPTDREPRDLDGERPRLEAGLAAAVGEARTTLAGARLVPHLGNEVSRHRLFELTLEASVKQLSERRDEIESLIGPAAAANVLDPLFTAFNLLAVAFPYRRRRRRTTPAAEAAEPAEPVVESESEEDDGSEPD